MEQQVGGIVCSGHTTCARVQWPRIVSHALGDPNQFDQERRLGWDTMRILSSKYPSTQVTGTFQLPILIPPSRMKCEESFH